MVSPSGKKDGLRCDCGKLLFENDPVMGLGVRCGRRECDKFHTLEEINQRAAEFEKQKENPREGKVVTLKTPSKTKIFNDLITIGLESGDPKQLAVSQYAKSLNFDIDKIEEIFGFSFTVASQFPSIGLSLCSARIDGLKVMMSINPFEFDGLIDSTSKNFSLTACTYKIGSKWQECLDHQFFYCNGLLKGVSYYEGMIKFYVKNLQGTATQVELYKDQIRVSIIGNEKHPNLLMAEFYIDQLSPMPI